MEKEKRTGRGGYEMRKRKWVMRVMAVLLVLVTLLGLTGC